MEINATMLRDKGILALHPHGPLEQADFSVITDQVNAYLAKHGTLHGVLIRTQSFPGWKDFAAMLAHFRFLKHHIQRIEKVAIVADGALADVMPAFANHFVHARVRHFAYTRADEAQDWLDQTGGTSTDSVA
jgi:hypothetical protein